MAKQTVKFNNKNVHKVGNNNSITSTFSQGSTLSYMEGALGNDAGKFLVRSEKNLQREKEEAATLKQITSELEKQGLIESANYKKAKEALDKKEKQIEANTKKLEMAKSIASDEANEYAKQATALWKSAEAIKSNAKAHEDNLELLKQEADIVSKSNISQSEKEKKLLEIAQKRRKEENEMRKEQGQMSVEEETFRQSSGLMNGVFNFLGKGSDDSTELAERFADIGDNLMGGIDNMSTVLGKLSSVVSSLDKAVDNAIDSAAEFLDKNYTKINANLIGTGMTYDTISDTASNRIGLSRFIEQTDYLSEIASLSEAGYNYNIEERAILQAIKEKTLHTFDATEGYLTRIVRLLQTDVSSAAFGTEYALKNLLNQVFQDTSYLNSLYDSVASAITDATVATNSSDITPFNSTVQTWLAYMYEAGLSESVISSLAEGINMLGSGDVQGLASNSQLQKLFLLSMDTVGMNYADVLQQGLDAESTNKLMQAVVQYLAEISENTSGNLVLQSAYGDLFNLSISDIAAIQNIADASISIVDSSQTAIDATKQAIATMEDNTLISTQWDNLMSNISFTFGNAIASNNATYATYKVSDFIFDIFSDYTDMGGVAGKVATAATALSGVTKMFAVLPGILELAYSAASLFSGDNHDISTYITGGSGTSIGGESVTGSIAASLESDDSEFITTDTSSDINSLFTNTETGESYSAEDWTDENDSTEIDILREIEKTIMTTEVDSVTNYAIAVSLEGMSNSVLKSFASIFADEDAMLETFNGDNNVITNALFNYTDDTSKDTRRVSMPQGLAADAAGTSAATSTTSGVTT